MASPPPIQVEDQTDVEFFDKLVDDDYGTRESRSNPDDLARALSMLSLPDEENSGSASDDLTDTLLEPSEISSGVALALVPSEAVSEELCCDVKRKSVKEVQWSDFNVDSQQFGLSGFESDVFLGSVDGILANPQTDSEPKSTFTDHSTANISSYSGSYGQQDNELHSSINENSVNSQEMQNWENLYPGWKYDTNTGQWHQIDGYVADRNVRLDNSGVAGQNSHEEGEVKIQNTFDLPISERSDSLYHIQASNVALEAIAEDNSVSYSWNQVSQGSIEYPHNMVFDPQYPGWYYDTTTQQWYTLESYNLSFLNASSINGDHHTTTVNALAGSTLGDNFPSCDNVQQYGKSTVQEHGSQPASGFGQQNVRLEQSSQGHWNGSGGGYDPRNLWQEQPSQAFGNALGAHYAQKEMWQPEVLPKNEDATSLAGNQLTGSFYNLTEYTGSPSFKSFGSNYFEPVMKHSYGSSNMISSQSYVTSELNYHSNQPEREQSHLEQLSNNNYGTESSVNSTRHSVQGVNPSFLWFDNSTRDGRSSAGRPPHALVAFGFGGKIIVTKGTNSTNSSFVSGSQGTVGGVISVHSLADVVKTKTDSLNILAGGGFGYFHSLCQQSFPGPLVGGNAASKDVNRWIDEMIGNCESSSFDVQTGELMRLLFSLLKILCQHYGKLRSPYGVNSSLEGSDGPESMVSQLFASVEKPNGPFGVLVKTRDCLRSFPVEERMKATAIEVQNLLVSGKRKDALQCAQEGQLWGPALVLSAQLGEQFYVETVKQMAHRQFVFGSPLRTLCLLIAGQPADVFSSENSSSGFVGAVNGVYQSHEVLPNSMLDDWKENLGIIISNRTKDDELVIIHMGDCLWKEKGEVTAAHTCYLVAEANFESYSDSARLCLIGADHWKNPRTYASPDAIQRTEIYEYSKVMGNTQFVLLPFQPYKLVYAYMLAEVGKVSDSLRYCQASMKLLKNAGRSPDVEMWRTLFSSLEKRLTIQQQGGYGTNLAPAKIVGKLLNSIDRSIHRIIGAPPLPPVPQNIGNGKDNESAFPKVQSSQSTTAITSLMPSASVEAISDLACDNNRKVVHSRSISEPNFGGSPKQISSKEGNSMGQSNLSISGGPSRFGRIGSQLLQKTIGWVSWSKNDRQAKLGESNKFYYDEKLKRWVEEGAEPPAEETSLPPPPTAATFENGLSNYNINNALKNNSLAPIPVAETTQISPSENGLGFPPLPPTQNQFSARSRMGVRSRYVDTFNKGGGSFTSSFQSPSIQSVKPPSGVKLMVPSTPMHFEDQIKDATKAGIHESNFAEEPSTSVTQESVFSPESTPSASMQRFPSMDQIALSNSLPSANGTFPHTRAASWSGAFADCSTAKVTGMEQSFVGSGVTSTLALQNKTSPGLSMQINGTFSAMDELQEVEL